MNSKQTFPRTTSARDIAPILGVYVSGSERSELLNQLIVWGGGAKRGSSQAQSGLRIIVTPNPEIVYRAGMNSEYAKILNKADLAIPDGIGLIWARNFLKVSAPKNLVEKLFLPIEALSCVWDTLVNHRQEVVPGRLVFEELVLEAGKRGWKVFLLGGAEGVAVKAAQELRIMNYELRIEDDAGPWLNEKGEPAGKEQAQIEKETIAKINKFKPDILFVAFGHPKQEFWLARNKSKLNAKMAMVVGGTFDYVAGIVPTPPKFISDLGLEWLFRLITQPTRAGRIYTAVVKFPLAVFKSKLQES